MGQQLFPRASALELMAYEVVTRHSKLTPSHPSKTDSMREKHSRLSWLRASVRPASQAACDICEHPFQSQCFELCLCHA